MKDNLYRLFMEMNIGDVLKDEDLKNHTTFKIGGPCDLMLLPKSYENVRDIVKYLRDEDIPFMVLGNGSNLLVKDSGLRKVVIKIADNLSNIRLDGNKIVAQAGAQLTTTSKFAIENSLEGMEFSSGIPGNIGGAITMNAGAYGGEMKDIVSSVKVIDINNEIRDFSCEQMHFGYRKSRVQEEGLIVLEAIFELNHGNYEEIYAKYKDFHDRRNSKQPLDYPSAGSVFKRPEGYYAGKLIEDSGLRGYRYKNAMVSEKHCGFIVTDGESSYEEVSKVIEHVKEVVYEKFGVKLETEIKIIGD